MGRWVKCFLYREQLDFLPLAQTGSGQGGREGEGREKLLNLSQEEKAF
jgi:hypothetical protein